MRDIQWLKDAEDELISIVNYVSQIQGINAAMQVYDDIISRVELLADSPELGTLENKHKFKNNTLRILHTKHTRIFYYVQGTRIVVVLLWNNVMDDKNIGNIISTRE